MDASRAKVIRAIKGFTDEMRLRAEREPGIELCQESEVVREILERACRENGLSVDDYAAALRADPALAELEKESLVMGIAEPPDPGPYDAISRESPSGQPGNLEKSRTLPRNEAPGGS